MPDCVVELHNVSKTLEQDLVLDEINFSLRRGEIHLIWGENGAGKSMLMRAICGLCTFDAGEIAIMGKTYRRQAPPLGEGSPIAILPQNGNLVQELTVFQNLFLEHNLWRASPESYFEKHIPPQLTPFAHCLRQQLREKVKNISAGSRQILQIVRTVISQKDILIFDEPLAFLNNYECEKFVDVLQGLKAAGKAIAVITHRAEMLMPCGDRITILKNGRVVLAAEKSQFSSNQLISSYVGANTLRRYPKLNNCAGGRLLEIEHLEGRALNNFSCRLDRGEIVGITGAADSGRDEVSRLLLGMQKKFAGIIRMEGHTCLIRHPSDAIRYGFYYLPTAHYEQGLFSQQDITFNIAGVSDRWKQAGKNQGSMIASYYMERLRIRADSPEEKVYRLSFGNRKKVAISRALVHHSEVYIFDEPTMGIDRCGQNEVYNIINHLSMSGAGVLLISSNFMELAAMCDRVCFLRRGSRCQIIEKEQLSPERLYALCGAP